MKLKTKRDFSHLYYTKTPCEYIGRIVDKDEDGFYIEMTSHDGFQIKEEDIDSIEYLDN